MTVRENLTELLKQASIKCQREANVSWEEFADHLLANGVIVLPNGGKDALFEAVNALADMVNQFGYSTTFRKKDAVCDGGLSALEKAFWALELCGCRVNSNGTITRANLWGFSIENKTDEALRIEAALKKGEKRYVRVHGISQDI